MLRSLVSRTAVRATSGVVTGRMTVAAATSTTTASATATATTTTTTTSTTLTAGVRALSSSVGGAVVADLAAASPHTNIVHYEHKNRVWTYQHVEYYSQALATGFLDSGLQQGDVVLSWMPDHWSETMVLQFACSKAGLVLYQLDPSVASTDAGSEALSAALTLTQANVLISPEAHDDVNYIRLVEGVVPELTYFDTSDGLPFVTPRFPHLRFCVHPGYDQEDKEGWFRYKFFVVPAAPPTTTPVVAADTPLAGQLQVDGRGVPTGLGTVLTNAQVVDQKIWPTYSAILEKEFHPVPGVGVIF